MRDVKREHDLNRVIDHVRINGTSARARLRVDQSHPFFYDHPLDHVPGLLQLEGILQLADALTVRLGCRDALLSRLQVEFEGYCLHSRAVDLEVEATGRNVLLAEVKQSGRVRSRGVIALGREEPVSQPSAAMPSWRRRLPPVSRKRVGKSRSENVMISRPCRQGEGLLARLLDAPCDNLLADPCTAEFRHPLYLLEGCMQVLRYENGFARGVGRGRRRDILAALDFRQHVPASRSETLWLRMGPPASLGDERRVLRTCEILDGKGLVANVRVLTVRPRACRVRGLRDTVS